MIPRYLAVGLLVGLTSLGVQAQQSLADLVSQAKADWMLGQWEAQGDNGETVRLNFSWDLDKHVVVLHVKYGDVETKGYTALEPNSPEPRYVSFDNRGAVGKGTWGMESDELVLRTQTQTPDQGPRKLAFVFSGNATDGLQVRMHSVSDTGNLESPARLTLKFKKQK